MKQEGPKEKGFPCTIKTGFFKKKGLSLPKVFFFNKNLPFFLQNQQPKTAGRKGEKRNESDEFFSF